MPIAFALASLSVRLFSVTSLNEIPATAHRPPGSFHLGSCEFSRDPEVVSRFWHPYWRILNWEWWRIPQLPLPHGLCGRAEQNIHWYTWYRCEDDDTEGFFLSGFIIFVCYFSLNACQTLLYFWCVIVVIHDQTKKTLATVAWYFEHSTGSHTHFLIHTLTHHSSPFVHLFPPFFLLHHFVNGIVLVQSLLGPLVVSAIFRSHPPPPPPPPAYLTGNWGQGETRFQGEDRTGFKVPVCGVKAAAQFSQHRLPLIYAL